MRGNKGTLANFWEQGNKTRKITVRKHSENAWEHGNIGQFWKGTREQGPPPPPGRPSSLVDIANEFSDRNSKRKRDLGIFKESGTL